MEKPKMNLEDEMIKKMITESFHKEGFDLNVEDEILNQVYLSQEKLNEIKALKRKAKIYLGITFGFLIIYALACTNMFISSSDTASQLSNNSVTFICFVMVGLFLVFYQLLYILNGNGFNQKSS